MKKLLFILLSVVLIGSVGCGSNKDLSMEVTDAGSTEIVNETVEPTTEAVTVETEDAGTAQQESTGTVAEVDSSADTKDTGKDNQSDNIASEEKNAENKKSEENKSSDSQKSEKQPKDTKSENFMIKKLKCIIHYGIQSIYILELYLIQFFLCLS